MDEILGAAVIGFLGLCALSPPLLLLFGLFALRRKRWDRAEDLATLAGVASWIFLCVEGVALLFAATYGGLSPFHFPPEEQALIAYPPAAWYGAYALTRSILRRRQASMEEARRRRGSGDVEGRAGFTTEIRETTEGVRENQGPSPSSDVSVSSVPSVVNPAVPTSASNPTPPDSLDG